MIDCPHPADAILANPYNGCVQCHRCGHVFEYLTDRGDREVSPDALRSSATELGSP